MTTYRNIGPEPLDVPSLALGRSIAAAGDADGDDVFDADEAVVHPLIECERNGEWVSTAALVDQAAEQTADAASQEQPTKRARAARKASKRGGGSS